MFLGVDVSNNNGVIHWKTAATGALDVAAIKASESTSFHDDYYHANLVGAEEVGLSTMAYHFGRPSKNTGAAEARYFLATTRSTPGPGRYALDLEDEEVDPHAGLAAYALDFLQTVAEATGKSPKLYTSYGYAHAHGLLNEPALGRFDLWLASWQDLEPSSFSPWSEWDGWQFTSKAYWPGIGKVDLSFWRNLW